MKTPFASNLRAATGIVAWTITALVFSSCGQTSAVDSSVSGGLAANKAAKTSSKARNVAIVALGDDGGIPGVHVDFKRMPELLERPELGFEVHKMMKPSPSALLAKVEELTAGMVQADREQMENGQPGGTFVIYVTSHGMQDGSTSMGGGMVNFNQISNAIAKGRRSGGNMLPLQRLGVMFDTCFSASNKGAVIAANNAGPATNTLASRDNTASQPGLFGDWMTLTTVEPVDSPLGGQAQKLSQSLAGIQNLYLSSFSWYSSRASETSADTGQGGAATTAFISAVEASLGMSPLGGAATNQAQGQTTDAGGWSNWFNLQDDDVVDPYANDEDPFAGNNPRLPNTTAGNDQIESQVQGDSSEILGTSHDHATTSKIGDVLSRMVSGAKGFGQTPIWCVDPVEFKDAYIADAPKGTLPIRIGPAEALNQGGKRHCSE